LNTSAETLIDIQEQLKERIAFVEKLNKQAKEAETIAALNKEQVNAINEILRINLEKNERKSFLKGFLVNFVFFVAGAVLSYLVAAYFL